MRYFFLFLILLVSGQLLHASGPVAKNDTVTIYVNFPVNFDIPLFVTDPTGGTLTVSVSFPPLNGATTVNGGIITYTPTHDFSGKDSFQYKACDTSGLCAEAEIYITVAGTNKPPVVVTDNYTFPDNVTSVVLNVLANDTDPAHDTLYVQAVLNVDSTDTLGSLSLDSINHNVVFTHTPNTCGQEAFDYIVCNLSICDTGIVTITVSCPDSIFFPQGFSPNGDGINDLLVFPGLLYFTPSTINIFNRYGTSVYQSTNYLNNWNGTDSDTGHPLPDGTYFYVLTLPSGKTYNNYIIINR